MESALELLTSLFSCEWNILRARFQDTDGSWITLPVEAIDGQPILLPLRQLHHQWEKVLNFS